MRCFLKTQHVTEVFPRVKQGLVLLHSYQFFTFPLKGNCDHWMWDYLKHFPKTRKEYQRKALNSCWHRITIQRGTPSITAQPVIFRNTLGFHQITCLMRWGYLIAIGEECWSMHRSQIVMILFFSQRPYYFCSLGTLNTWSDYGWNQKHSCKKGHSFIFFCWHTHFYSRQTMKARMGKI